MTRSNNPLVAAIKGSIRHCNPSRHGSLYYIDPRELMKALERADELSRAAPAGGTMVERARENGSKIVRGLQEALTCVKGEGGRVDLTVYKVRTGPRDIGVVKNTKTGETRIVRLKP